VAESSGVAGRRWNRGRCTGPEEVEPEAKREEEDAWTGRAFRLTCDGSRVNLTHGGIPNDGLGASELATYQ
jgi:hypothetical protein